LLPPQPSDFEESKDSSLLGIADWIVIFTGFGVGTMVGIVMGKMLTCKYHEWFLERPLGGKNKIREARGREEGRELKLI